MQLPFPKFSSLKMVTIITTQIFFIFFFYCFYLNAAANGQFPSWLEPSDRKLLLAKEVHYDVKVATDGSGNFTRVIDAVKIVPEKSVKRFTIYVKKGIYYENVLISENKINVVLIGDGRDSTVISGNLSRRQNKLGTYNTATFGVKGRNFIARGISFRNTAGPENEQAVALVSSSDSSVFYQCGFYGYQDTLYAHTGLQFYRECVIHGTVDFIFGYATAVFQNCQILVRKGRPNQKNTITAQGGKSHLTPYGFSFQFCNISADLDLLPEINSTETFLGRPWKAYSTVIFMQSYISEVLSPRGWMEWNKSQYLDTLYFAEYKNYGPGAGVASRVNWTNYHILNDSSQVSKFTVAQFILGDHWLPLTGVPYTPGLGTQNITTWK